MSGGPRDAHETRPEGGRRDAVPAPRLLATRVGAEGRRRSPARAAPPRRVAPHPHRRPRRRRRSAPPLGVRALRRDSYEFIDITPREMRYEARDYRSVESFIIVGPCGAQVFVRFINFSI